MPSAKLIQKVGLINLIKSHTTKGANMLKRSMYKLKTENMNLGESVLGSIFFHFVSPTTSEAFKKSALSLLL